MGLYKTDGEQGSGGRAARSDLRDARGGVHDADVPAPAGPADDMLPEGLRRERKGPYGPRTGRTAQDAAPTLGSHAEQDMHVERKRP